MALFWTPVVVFYVLLFPGGLTHYFYRYQHPIMPLLAVLAGGGAAYVITRAMAGGVVPKLLVVLGLIVVIVPVWQQYERWRGIYKESAFETAVDLEAMARDLNTIVQPNQVLAAHDIGAVAYYADYQVLDLVGLVNPKVIPYHKDRRVREYLEGARPDYLLTFPDWDFYFLHIYPGDDPAHFELIKTYPGRNIRQSPYLLYKVTYD
jgi:hypothetical protein